MKTTMTWIFLSSLSISGEFSKQEKKGQEEDGNSFEEQICVFSFAYLLHLPLEDPFFFGCFFGK